MKRFFTYFLSCIFCILKLYSSEGERPSDCFVGNFALRPSQEPSPLVSFGQNIVDQNQTLFFVAPDVFLGKNQSFTDVVISAVYGITDDLSLFLNFPIAADYQQNGHHSSGIEDISAQLEYAFYVGEGRCYTNQATIVANATFPSGSSRKNPPTGFGSMSYFIGGTFNHTRIDWFFFTSYGAQLTTTEHSTKFGNLYLYQGAFGRNIHHFKTWIVAWMVEIDGKIDPDTGGNVVYLTPSLFASTQHWILQAGVGYAIQQHLFGHQNRQAFLFALDFVRTF